MRLMWPACRLPIVGTNTTRLPLACQAATCSRTSAMVVIDSMRRPESRMELVLGRGIGLLFDRVHVALQGVEIRVRAFHEILHEPRLALRREVEHVVKP